MFYPKKIKKFEILSPVNALMFQYDKKIPKIFEISNFSFLLEKEIKCFDNLNPNDPKAMADKLKMKVLDLTMTIKAKKAQINKIEKEKEDMKKVHQLFTESSNEQIESLSNENKEYIAKNEKLTEEINTIKQELEKTKNDLENKIKQSDEEKSNLNKTIEELTKDNSKLKLDLFKKNNELEEVKHSHSSNTTHKEKESEKVEEKPKENVKEIDALKEEIKKLKQDKIIEVSLLKREIAKQKLEIMRLNNKEKAPELNKTFDYSLNDLNKNDVLNENDEINTLKNKNKEYQEQIDKLKAEIEEYKKNGNDKGDSTADAKQIEELKKQNTLCLNKLKEAQAKIVQANSLINKAKKYNICVSYVSQLLNLTKPENEKQTYIFHKLKVFVEEYEKEKNVKRHE